MPGRTSDGHHQIESACSTCHTPWGGVLEDACLRCHGEALRAQNDSHAPAKFDDPAVASQLDVVDARSCVACHREHRPEARDRGTLTVQAGVCAACHATVGQDRPSHAAFGPETCARSGCHNYHDNRGLFEAHLKRTRGQPDLRSPAQVAERSSTVRLREAGAPAAVRPDVPDAHASERDLVAATAEWKSSAHERAGVNCSGCHAPVRGQKATDGAGWTWKVPQTTCASCHAGEVAGFKAGRHGMREAEGLPAMSPALARAPMHAEAQGRTLGCDSCHGGHSYDVGRAAVEACEGCHADEHTRAFRDSRHFALWQRERSGQAAAGTGVSCATCHLPRQTNERRHVTVQHNQNDNLRPRDRMVRDVCSACHGVGFSLRSLADMALVTGNFQGQARSSNTGMDLIERGGKTDGQN